MPQTVHQPLDYTTKNTVRAFQVFKQILRRQLFSHFMAACYHNNGKERMKEL
jgi:hypothetical protein